MVHGKRTGSSKRGRDIVLRTAMQDYKQKLEGLVELTIAQGASDLHLGTGIQPSTRVSGVMAPITSEPGLTGEDMLGILDAMLTPELKKSFIEKQKIDI